MTRIAVTADLHCDDFPGRIDPESGLNARWVDTVAMARWVAEDAKARGAEVLVVGGDFTEARHPAPWRVAQIGEALAAFPGPEVLAGGNHDGKRAGRSIVDVLAAGRALWSGLSAPGIANQDGVAIAVIPYLDRHQLRALPGYETLPDAELSRVLGEAFLTIARGLYVQAKAISPAAVLVVHQALAGGLMSDTQAAFLGDQGLVVDTRALGAIGFEAILAGHFHKHQVLSTDPLIAYAGSPYRTDFGEEHQAKGYLVVDVEPGRATMEFVETPARRFVTLDALSGGLNQPVEDAIVRVVNLDPAEDVNALRNLLLVGGGAFEVQEIRVRPVDRPEIAGGMAEGLTAPQALETYFADDDDREALVERGRGILAEVVG